jgi:hypothetical protein
VKSQPEEEEEEVGAVTAAIAAEAALGRESRSGSGDSGALCEVGLSAQARARKQPRFLLARLAVSWAKAATFGRPTCRIDLAQSHSVL